MSAMPPRCPVRPCPPSPAGRGGGCSRCSADPAPLPLRSGSAALACGTCALGGAVLTPEHDTARGSRSHTGPTGPDPNRPWPGAGGRGPGLAGPGVAGPGVGWPGREWRPLPPGSAQGGGGSSEREFPLWPRESSLWNELGTGKLMTRSGREDWPKLCPSFPPSCLFDFTLSHHTVFTLKALKHPISILPVM